MKLSCMDKCPTNDLLTVIIINSTNDLTSQNKSTQRMTSFSFHPLIYGLLKSLFTEKICSYIRPQFKYDYIQLLWEILLLSFRWSPIGKGYHLSHSWKISMAFNMDSCKNLLVLLELILQLLNPLEITRILCRLTTNMSHRIWLVFRHGVPEKLVSWFKINICENWRGNQKWTLHRQLRY